MNDFTYLGYLLLVFIILKVNVQIVRFSLIHASVQQRMEFAAKSEGGYTNGRLGNIVLFSHERGTTLLVFAIEHIVSHKTT
jgi:hypothetical protein